MLSKEDINKMKRKFIIAASIFIFIIFIISFFGSAIYLRTKYTDIYNQGVKLLYTGDYIKAIDCFNDIPDYMNYKDISDLLEGYQVVCPHCGELLN